MRVFSKILAVAVLLLFAVGLLAAPTFDRITVPKGTDVNLVFDQGLNSKTAKVGDTVRLHVGDSVMVGDKTVVKEGTPVTGVLTQVKHRKRFGVNAKIMIALNPVMSTYGKTIPLEPSQKGRQIGGKKSEQAGGASIGGAIVLGPIGLVGGYFVNGKRVVVKPGDSLATEVANTTVLRHQRR